MVTLGCARNEVDSEELAGRLAADGYQLVEDTDGADAVLGFDDYPDIAARLRSVLAGDRLLPHTPRDRRKLLPISPVQRSTAVTDAAIPGHDWLRRKRLASGPSAALKLASGRAPASSEP